MVFLDFLLRRLIPPPITALPKPMSSKVIGSGVGLFETEMLSASNAYDVLVIIKLSNSGRSRKFTYRFVVGAVWLPFAALGVVISVPLYDC